jgi:hypothetical protein
MCVEHAVLLVLNMAVYIVPDTLKKVKDGQNYLF